MDIALRTNTPVRSTLRKLSPCITTMIRMDHTHVLALARRYHPDSSPEKKLALATNACLALEIHAQLEEEIFYPALRSGAGSDPILDKSVPEHNEMRRLISALRNMQPEDGEYDTTFMELIRLVLHHVADEETRLLPEAERVLGGQLRALGQQMTKRRMQLLRPHAMEVTKTAVRSFPIASAMTALITVLLGSLLVRQLTIR
ncbi:MAG TPA: hemerythrin domain-containing protein [Burkholderiaceae bacterium]|nr:hemerythrin domain-containing protein [Burkholderiaceae bacterium]